MTFLIYSLIGAVLGGLVGAFAGWLARGREEVVVEKIVVQTVEKIVERIVERVVEKPAGATDPREEQASEILAQLQELTTGVSQQIDAHARTVGDINDELSHAGAEEGGAVLTAIRRLIESNNAMQEQLVNAQQELQDQSQQLTTHREEARTDPLTNLCNRRGFDAELALRVAAFQRQGTPVQLMLLDVDHFKKFNDCYGHLAGDEVLREVGRILSRETKGHAELFAARYGGEEFALLLGSPNLKDAALVGDQVRALIGAATVPFESQSLQVTASAGVAQLTTDESVRSLISRADEALYAAKKTGRNCTCMQSNGEVSKVTLKPAPMNVSRESRNEIDDAGELAKTIGRRIAEWRRGGVSLSMIVARLDDSATVEKQLGREGLEKAKDAVATVFKRALRDMDQVANIAGETFGLLLPTAKVVDAARIADRIRTSIDSSEFTKIVGCHVTVSLGVAEVNHTDDADAFLARSRRAMELARRQGGNMVFINDGIRSDAAIDRLDMAAEKWAAV